MNLITTPIKVRCIDAGDYDNDPGHPLQQNKVYTAVEHCIGLNTNKQMIEAIVLLEFDELVFDISRFVIKGTKVKVHDYLAKIYFESNLN